MRSKGPTTLKKTAFKKLKRLKTKQKVKSKKILLLVLIGYPPTDRLG